MNPILCTCPSTSYDLPSFTLAFLDPLSISDQKEEFFNTHPLAMFFQSQYQKNLGLIKEKFKKCIPVLLVFSTYQKYASILIENKNLTNLNHEEVMMKMYCFLCSLAFYETQSQKFHDSYKSEGWNEFSLFCNTINLKLSLSEIMLMKDQAFKKNSVNYKWSEKEDEILEHIVMKHQKQEKTKLPWQKITNEFNQSLKAMQIRSAAHCRERWMNTLKNKFKKGKWTKQEDLKILKLVFNRGTKWSLLAKESRERTEHNFKNRFFCILSSFLKKTTRTIKKEKAYLSPQLLNNVIEKLENIEKNENENI